MQTESQARYRSLNFSRFRQSAFWLRLDPYIQRGLEVASSVLPFRTNEYVLEELINWDNIPADPIFQLTFPQRGMLEPDDFERLSRLIFNVKDEAAIARACGDIHHSMNPHPAGQTDHNVPELDGRPLDGMQHKYMETLLYFPGAARSCHAYCTFCFRWALFVQGKEHHFARPRIEDLCAYIKLHPEITDVLLSGGDPMVMSAKLLRRHIEPLLDPRNEHVQNIRIGTKSLSYWPNRYVNDADSDEILRLFEDVVAAGKHLSIMGHYNHPVELSTKTAQEAIRRIRSTGALFGCKPRSYTELTTIPTSGQNCGKPASSWVLCRTICSLNVTLVQKNISKCLSSGRSISFRKPTATVVVFRRPCEALQ